MELGSASVKKTAATQYTETGEGFDTDDIGHIALDMDNLKFYIGKGDSWFNSGDPTSGATGTGAVAVTAPGSVTVGTGEYFPAQSDPGHAVNTMEWSFGGCPAFALSSAAADANGYGAFEYAPPSGYLAICTKNLGSDGG